jgi:hypothetical protein
MPRRKLTLISDAQLQEDYEFLQALRQIPNYEPESPELSVEALTAQYNRILALREKIKRMEQKLKALQQQAALQGINTIQRTRAK